MGKNRGGQAEADHQRHCARHCELHRASSYASKYPAGFQLFAALGQVQGVLLGLFDNFRQGTGHELRVVQPPLYPDEFLVQFGNLLGQPGRLSLRVNAFQQFGGRKIKCRAGNAGGDELSPNCPAPDSGGA